MQFYFIYHASTPVTIRQPSVPYCLVSHSILYADCGVSRPKSLCNRAMRPSRNRLDLGAPPSLKHSLISNDLHPRLSCHVRLFVGAGPKTSCGGQSGFPELLRSLMGGLSHQSPVVTAGPTPSAPSARDVVRLNRRHGDPPCAAVKPDDVTVRPDDLRPYATVRPDDLRSDDLRPDDLRPDVKVRSDDLRLYVTIRPDDLRPYVTVRPDDLRPDVSQTGWPQTRGPQIRRHGAAEVTDQRARSDQMTSCPWWNSSSSVFISYAIHRFKPTQLDGRPEDRHRSRRTWNWKPSEIYHIYS